MKNIIIVLVLIIILGTGCTKFELSDDYSLKEFYTQSLKKDLSEISLESSKKMLEKFEYKYEVQSYSEEEKQKYEKEFEKPFVVSDFSSNIFLDESKNSIDILYNETKKEVSSVSYEEINDFESKKMVRDKEGFSVHIVTKDIDTQSDIMNRLGLSRDSKEVVESYFELINEISKNSDIDIEDVKSILKLDYKKKGENKVEENLNEYEFKNKKENISVDVKVIDGFIESVDLNSGIGDEFNYSFKIYSESEDEGSKKNIYITENVKLREDNKNDKEFFDFLYNEGELRYYNE